MYVKAPNNVAETYPYSIGDLRRDNPNTSFPKAPTDTLLADWDMHPVTIAQDPAYDPITHKIVNDALPTLINGAWILAKSAVEMTQDEKDAYRAKTVRQYELAVQDHMDVVAGQRNYDSMLSAATYAASKNGRYGLEGKACVDWRDDVWDTCYAILSDVEAGNRTPPTVEELISELPTMVWPVI